MRRTPASRIASSRRTVLTTLFSAKATGCVHRDRHRHQRRQVDDDVVAGQPVLQLGFLLEVALDEDGTARHHLAVAGREVVEDGDLVAGSSRTLAHVAADEAGAAGDEYSHLPAIASLR